MHKNNNNKTCKIANVRYLRQITHEIYRREIIVDKIYNFVKSNKTRRYSK